MRMPKRYIFMNLLAMKEGKVFFFSENFSGNGIGLKQVSHYELKLVPLFSIVKLFLCDCVC